MDEPPTRAADEAVADPCPACGRPVGEAWMVCAWCGEPIAAPAELPVGSALGDGRYQILRVIGRGGFGITYEAGDRRLERRVAIKELFPEAAVRHGSKVLTPPAARAGFRDARDRFLREARVLARFSHPGIVRVFEVFEEHGTAYLVMELLDGRTLVDLLRQRGRPFTEPEVLDVAGRMAAALRTVHVAGLLHRDLNPSNVVLTTHGRVVLIDFGLARAFDLDQTVGMTRVVTPGYAPLEQYRGEARFGPATDVYGLAATLYRLSTGRVPVAALDRDGGTALPPPSARNPAISKPVSDAILDGLELEPSHRPQDVDAFVARLGLRGLPEGPRSLLLDGGFDLGPDTPEGAAPALPVAPPPPPAPTAVAPVPATAVAPVEPASAASAAVPAPAPVAPAATALAGDPTSATRVVGGGDPALDPTRGAPLPPVPPAPSLPPPPPRPLTASALVPGSDVRAPLAVGPHPPGRRKLTIPLLAVVAAIGSAAPVLAEAVLVLLALPALATLGDLVAAGLRAEHGLDDGWGARLPTPVRAVGRFCRNVAVSVVRSSPLIGIGAVLLAGWFAVEHTSAPDGLVDGVLRVVGALVVTLTAVASREGSASFRTGLGLDDLVRRGVPDGRTTERVVVGWIVAVLVVAACLWLHPDPFPL